MHQNLRSERLVVSRQTVRVIIRSLDPAGVERRSGRKLQRRVYRDAPAQISQGISMDMTNWSHLVSAFMAVRMASVGI